MSPRVRISIKIDHVKSIRRDRLWLREEKIPCEPPTPHPPSPRGGHFKADYQTERKVYLPPQKM